MMGWRLEVVWSHLVYHDLIAIRLAEAMAADAGQQGMLALGYLLIQECRKPKERDGLTVIQYKAYQIAFQTNKDLAERFKAAGGQRASWAVFKD